MIKIGGDSSRIVSEQDLLQRTRYAFPTCATCIWKNLHIPYYLEADMRREGRGIVEENID